MTNKLINWFKQSNRYKHLIGGMLVAIPSCSWLIAIYVSLVAGLCLEYKDKCHGCKFDWIDVFCTVLGGIITAIVYVAIKGFAI